jgi:Uma2 family endonuclease
MCFENLPDDAGGTRLVTQLRCRCVPYRYGPLQTVRRAEHTMGMPAIRRHWTTADVRALIDESPTAWPRYELIGGELIVTPAPGGSHQFAVEEILIRLATYLRDEPVGAALFSPADLELEPGTITQPDVFVIPAGGAPSDNAFRWSDVSSLLLAVEVISPSSIRTDRITKRDYYMNAGVPDYLSVDVDARMIERWTQGRETPSVLRDRLAWHPAGARSALDVALPEYFDRITAQMRLIGNRNVR